MCKSLSKVELAKMLGLEFSYGYGTVSKYDIETLIELDYMTIEWSFNAGIDVRIEQEDFCKNKLDIQLSDLEKDEDIKVCIKQCEDLLLERAADEYLGKIKSLVETIKV